MMKKELRCLYMQLGQHMWRGPMDTFNGKVRGDAHAPRRSTTSVISTPSTNSSQPSKTKAKT